MEIRLYATLRLVTGRSSIDVTTGPGDTVRTLLAELATSWPTLKNRLFRADGTLNPSIHLFINGRDFRYLGGLETVIPPDAEICLFPPVGGGR